MYLSVGLITHNEEHSLRRTLEAVEGLADEIVIVDSGSTDRTAEIAAEFDARFYVEEWKGFGPQKNSVIEKCRGDWILLIDADEKISYDLANMIECITFEDPPEYEVYKIKFISFCFGEPVLCGGWSDFYRIRLFRNGAGKYDDSQVHETFITGKKVGKLKQAIYHYTYETLADCVDKMNRYSTEAAFRYRLVGRRAPLFRGYFTARFHFIMMYIFKLGFMDGRRGYWLAKMSALYAQMKYAKLRGL